MEIASNLIEYKYLQIKSINNKEILGAYMKLLSYKMRNI